MPRTERADSSLARIGRVPRGGRASARIGNIGPRDVRQRALVVVPPPASPARVTDALAGLVVDDDPRAAIAGLIRATPKRTRTSSAGSDDSNTALASPAASSAAAAAADVIARARAAAAGDDAVWRTAKAAVDAVAAATRPATFETKRKDSLGAGDAAHVVARAASARA